LGTKDTLVKAVEVVAFLFAAFSGFLKNIAPPEEADATFAMGISSFLMLAVLLIISALAKGERKGPAQNRLWLGASGLFFVAAGTAAFLYKGDLDRLTFADPPESTRRDYLTGTVWTPAAQEYRRANPQKTVSDIVADFGGHTRKELVWTLDSIQSVRMRCAIHYVALVLCLATTIFCLTEGVLAGRERGPARSRARQKISDS
jgi:hypothetical protein